MARVSVQSAESKNSAEAALAQSPQKRKETSRDRLLSAAAEAFCASGYFTVSVDEISAAAGVSRMTFYRCFAGKSAIAAELFRQNAEAAMPRYLAIGKRDFCDRAVIANWIEDLFSADRQSRHLLRVFTQANADEPAFTQSAQSFISDLIVGLGKAIPAFAIDPSQNGDRRRWLKAWLLLYEILDQANHAARDLGVASDPLVTEILAERFLAFVNEDQTREVKAKSAAQR